MWHEVFPLRLKHQRQLLHSAVSYVAIIFEIWQLPHESVVLDVVCFQ